MKKKQSPVEWLVILWGGVLIIIFVISYFLWMAQYVIKN